MYSVRRRWITGLLVALITVPTLSAANSAGAASGPTAAHGAAGVWSASLEGVHGVSPDATIRQIARVSVPGSGIRVRLGNPFGSAPVVIREAWLGRPIAPGAPKLVNDSNKRLTFRGARSVTIPPGQSVVSDSVPVTVRAQQDVAVSIYAPGSPVNDHTFPPFAYDPPASYIGTGGNTASDPSDAAFPGYPVIPGNTSSTAVGYHPGQTWWLDLVTVDRPEAKGTLVTLGDSITDGYNAYGPPGQRWTDVLADRLNALPASARVAVANAGISGNTVSVQPNPYDPTGQCCGPPAPQRLDRDVFSVPGVRTVLLLEGTNDLGGGDNAPPASSAQVIDAMRGIADRVHARHLRIVGATVLPMCNAAGSTKENNRLAVNEWIRTSGVFDEVLDFDAVLRDPADPTVMIADLRNDCYHPNAAGDAVLGRFIPLSAVVG
ncbi:lysophospholipase L1-like esterase [Actinoplanes tereljensis]|uniref:SGNH hydrolase n=1 Tax=Paractinoplanes tereljensis TaxID=571912 RepID=A0A919NWE0_9ACTN|nr:GDSL-type esterase/lipase family protein [Actinoplanes tereljensis]GIF24627.1 SGNH hydrolase [Actinoplanes tereljensis]